MYLPGDLTGMNNIEETIRQTNEKRGMEVILVRNKIKDGADTDFRMPLGCGHVKQISHDVSAVHEGISFVYSDKKVMLENEVKNFVLVNSDDAVEVHFNPYAEGRDIGGLMFYEGCGFDPSSAGTLDRDWETKEMPS